MTKNKSRPKAAGVVLSLTKKELFRWRLLVWEDLEQTLELWEEDMREMRDAVRGTDEEGTLPPFDGQDFFQDVLDRAKFLNLLLQAGEVKPTGRRRSGPSLPAPPTGRKPLNNSSTTVKEPLKAEHAPKKGK